MLKRKKSELWINFLIVGMLGWLLILVITLSIESSKYSVFSRKSRLVFILKKALYGSSCPEVFCGKGVLRNFTKFTRKHICQSIFFNKVAGLRPATLLKKETLAQVLYSECCEISKNTFFTEHLRTTRKVC